MSLKMTQDAIPENICRTPDFSTENFRLGGIRNDFLLSSVPSGTPATVTPTPPQPGVIDQRPGASRENPLTPQQILEDRSLIKPGAWYTPVGKTEPAQMGGTDVVATTRYFARQLNIPLGSQLNPVSARELVENREQYRAQIENGTGKPIFYYPTNAPLDVRPTTSHNADAVFSTLAGREGISLGRQETVALSFYSREAFPSVRNGQIVTASGQAGVTLQEYLETGKGFVQCAVDPSFIPLGSKFEITMGGKRIPCVAVDTGGDIQGNRIDVYTGTQSEAINLGRMTATATLPTR